MSELEKQPLGPYAPQACQARRPRCAIRPFDASTFRKRNSPNCARRITRRAGRKGNGHGCIAGRAARDDAETRALLGDGVRLAQGRGETERPAEVHHRDRRAGHPFHSRAFEASRMRLPVIVTHGWPGSIIEQMKIIDPLTNPTAHGGTAADAFDVVIPSMPGYGFSGKPTDDRLGTRRASRAPGPC